MVDSPLKIHGGKHYLAERIVALMPPHVHYVEPYAGGLSVLLAKNPEGHSEVVNDLNGELTCFWTILKNPLAFEIFRRRLEATPFSENEWNDACVIPDSAKDYFIYGGITVVRAINFFIRCRQSLAGRMQSFAPLSRTRTRRGMNEQVSAWLSAIEGLPEVHARLKRVAILNRPALEVILQEDGPDTIFYLDPPYLHSTRATTKEYGKFEMTEQDHVELLSTLAGLKGKWMLSGYDSPLYQSFFRDIEHRRYEFELPNNSAGGKKKARKIECLWCNFDKQPTFSN